MQTYNNLMNFNQQLFLQTLEEQECQEILCLLHSWRYNVVLSKYPKQFRNREANSLGGKRRRTNSIGMQHKNQNGLQLMPSLMCRLPQTEMSMPQKISSEVSATRYFLYIYNISANVWSLVESSFDVKAVRFDRLGNIYYLDAENCARNSLNEKLICGVSDFEVTVEKKIIALNDGSGIVPADTVSSQFKPALVSQYQYKAITGFKGITLLKDEPILISNDGTVDAVYGGGKLVSISAGIDGSLWALQDENNATDFTLLKWQTVAQKWYSVEGAKGVCLSAYNEISVALVNSIGLLSLSSQTGHQNEAEYVVTVPTSVPTSEPSATSPSQSLTQAPSTQPPATTTTQQQIIVNSQQYQSLLANADDFQWIMNQIPNKNFTKVTQIYGADENQRSIQEGIDAFSNRTDIILLYKTDHNSITGYYINGSTPSDSSPLYRRVKSVIFSLSARQSLPYNRTEVSTISYYSSNKKFFVLSASQIDLVFTPRCGSDINGYYTDDFQNQEEEKQGSQVTYIRLNSLLTGNSVESVSAVSCKRIEMYLAQ
ncbi:UNKNOWN [Stylonychia lemnae]|uniref:TLDc domain-containing protein n=1 Tax=Stylonychia lemnae TaxID=5949 RepID=A0A078AT51_STYLE|nr:UNKNOWN [Stylonychia lemnae]|eukprot:CDW85364.1 UNKNOWN [Stylonychia lemnae]